jgi:hypothetical protein
VAQLFGSFPPTSIYRKRGDGVVSGVAHKLRCFISSGSIATAPYISQDGVKFVVLQTIVL